MVGQPDQGAGDGPLGVLGAAVLGHHGLAMTAAAAAEAHAVAAAAPALAGAQADADARAPVDFGPGADARRSRCRRRCPRPCCRWPCRRPCARTPGCRRYSLPSGPRGRASPASGRRPVPSAACRRRRRCRTSRTSSARRCRPCRPGTSSNDGALAHHLLVAKLPINSSSDRPSRWNVKLPAYQTSSVRTQSMNRAANESSSRTVPLRRSATACLLLLRPYEAPRLSS